VVENLSGRGDYSDNRANALKPLGPTVAQAGSSQALPGRRR